jgi:hypothetical protein
MTEEQRRLNATPPEEREAMMAEAFDCDDLEAQPAIVSLIVALKDADEAAGRRWGEESIQASFCDLMNTEARQLGYAEETDYLDLGKLQVHFRRVVDAAWNKGAKDAAKAAEAAGERRGRVAELEAIADIVDAGETEPETLSSILKYLGRRLFEREHPEDTP